MLLGAGLPNLIRYGLCAPDTCSPTYDMERAV